MEHLFEISELHVVLRQTFAGPSFIIVQCQTSVVPITRWSSLRGSGGARPQSTHFAANAETPDSPLLHHQVCHSRTLLYLCTTWQRTVILYSAVQWAPQKPTIVPLTKGWHCQEGWLIRVLLYLYLIFVLILDTGSTTRTFEALDEIDFYSNSIILCHSTENTLPHMTKLCLNIVRQTTRVLWASGPPN